MMMPNQFFNSMDGKGQNQPGSGVTNQSVIGSSGGGTATSGGGGMNFNIQQQQQQQQQFNANQFGSNFQNQLPNFSNAALANLGAQLPVNLLNQLNAANNSNQSFNKQYNKI
jgi:hypothetical protein